METKQAMMAFALLLLAAPALGANTPSLWGVKLQNPLHFQMTQIAPVAAAPSPVAPPQTDAVVKLDPTQAAALELVLRHTALKQEAAKLAAAQQQQQQQQQPQPQQQPQQQPVQEQQQPQPQQPQQQPKKQQEKFSTCSEATDKIPGYSFTAQALQQCPELLALQQDPTVAKTFFVPSDKAIKNLAEYAHIPVQLLSSSKVKGMMCNVLKYHVVDGVHLKRQWTVGQKLPTMYNNAEITISAVGQQPMVTTTTGVQANIKRTVFCGNSVVFGTDAVLTPFKVPKLGLGRH